MKGSLLKRLDFKELVSKIVALSISLEIKRKPNVKAKRQKSSIHVKGHAKLRPLVNGKTM